MHTIKPAHKPATVKSYYHHPNRYNWSSFSSLELHTATSTSTFARSAVCLFAGCITSQQHASVSQGRICSDNFTCCHTEIEVADPTFHLTRSKYTDTGPTSPSTDPTTSGTWRGSRWTANFLSHWYDSTLEKSRCKRDLNPGSSALEGDTLTTRPIRRLPEAWTGPLHKLHPWNWQANSGACPLVVPHTSRPTHSCLAKDTLWHTELHGCQEELQKNSPVHLDQWLASIIFANNKKIYACSTIGC